MEYSFNVEVATKYGVNESVFIHNIYWWMVKNKANDKHFYDGRYWTYNSMKAFTELFPFWSVDQIRRIIRKLSESGALKIGNYNKASFDRTQWYSLSDEVLEMFTSHKHQMQVAKFPNASGETTAPIPDINTDSKPYIPPISPKGEDDGFNTFWKAYPRKIAKANALKSWKKIKPDDELQKTILSALEQHKKTEQWLRDKGQFIPHPATWLNQSRWLDELEFDIHQTKTTEKPRRFERKEVDGEIVEIEVFD